MLPVAARNARLEILKLLRLVLELAKKKAGLATGLFAFRFEPVA
jgi:hypothetical protein